MSRLLELLSNDLATVTARAKESLVHIQNGGGGAGAGSIWHSNGLIVTNAHVLHAPVVRVTLPDGRQATGKVLAKNPVLDLAALSVDITGLPTVELGDSRGLRPGQVVLAIGHPWGVPGAVTKGIIIAAGAEAPDVPGVGREWIVADLGLRPGNSGGPLLDSEGRLIGINAMITGPKVALAVPVHVAKAFLQEALKASRAA